jgi:hypothetical protein
MLKKACFFLSRCGFATGSRSRHVTGTWITNRPGHNNHLGKDNRAGWLEAETLLATNYIEKDGAGIALGFQEDDVGSSAPQDRAHEVSTRDNSVGRT